jgi:membrane-associated protein
MTRLVIPLLLGVNWMSPDWLLQQFGQSLVWVSLRMIFVECGLLFPCLPGDTLLFALGLFVATGDLSVISDDYGVGLALALSLFSLAAFLGNVAGYEIGRLAGPRLYQRDSRFLRRRHLDKTQAFFERHGNRAILLGRFVPFVRTYVTLVAGVGRMERRRFLIWSGAGAMVWVATITLLGYFLGNTVPSLKDNVDYAILAILAFSAAPAGYHWWRRRRQTQA